MIPQQATMKDALNEARCSNELLEHLEHLRETNDLFGNVAKSQGQCPGDGIGKVSCTANDFTES